MSNPTDTDCRLLVPALTVDDFDEATLGADGTVVVDLWTAWCGPCKVLEPVLIDVARELAGSVRFYKVDAEEHPGIAIRFNVMSFPTLLVFTDGELVDRLIGSRGRRHLLEDLARWA